MGLKDGDCISFEDFLVIMERLEDSVSPGDFSVWDLYLNFEEEKEKIKKIFDSIGENGTAKKERIVDYFDKIFESFDKKDLQEWSPMSGGILLELLV